MTVEVRGDQASGLQVTPARSGLRHFLWTLGTVAAVAAASLGNADAQKVTPNAVFTIGTVYTDSISLTCSTEVVCQVQFHPVPEGKFLLVTNVTCNIGMNANGSIERAKLARRFVTADERVMSPFTHLTPALISDSTTRKFFQSNDPARHPFTSGQTPVVSISAATGRFVSAECSIFATIGDSPA